MRKCSFMNMKTSTIKPKERNGNIVQEEYDHLICLQDSKLTFITIISDSAQYLYVKLVKYASH